MNFSHIFRSMYFICKYIIPLYNYFNIITVTLQLLQQYTIYSNIIPLCS